MEPGWRFLSVFPDPDKIHEEQGSLVNIIMRDRQGRPETLSCNLETAEKYDLET